MSRRYDTEVQVRRRDDVPAEFLWGGRFYVVREVLGHWREAGAWWRGIAARAVLGADTSFGPDAIGDAQTDAQTDAQSTAAFPAGSLAIDDTEREIWRVEATAGRAAGSGIYDLSFDWATGAWTLARALD